MQIGRGISCITSYLGSARPRKKEDLLTYRRFDRELYARGEPEGPSLLLRSMRGNKVDWNGIVDKHTPLPHCKGPCLSAMPKADVLGKERLNKKDTHSKVGTQKMRERAVRIGVVCRL